MAAEAEAAREARAKVIRANGEEKATKALKQAADELVDSPCAMQLRYLQVNYLVKYQKMYSGCYLVHYSLSLFQTLNSIGNEKNTTIVFPIPIDTISWLGNNEIRNLIL